MLYPLTDDAPARLRSFQCRESLWMIFEELAAKDGAPIDHLVEEAMIFYAKKRGNLELPTQAGPPGRDRPNLEETQDAYAARQPPPRRLDPPQGRSYPGVPPPPAPPPRRAPSDQPPRTQRLPGSPPGRGLPAPVPPGPSARMPSGRTFSPAPAPSPSGRGNTRPPPLPSSSPPAAYAAPQRGPRTLRLMYQGRPYVVDKDRYLIGRSKTQADLRVDDSNVSRQHAMIEKVGDAWYIVDLGSTNGVSVAGERVARRALRDGDVLEITTHQIAVTIA